MHESVDLISSIATSGIHAHNRKDFYTAHEHFETAWRNTSGPEREFYRALLHLTGGHFRLTENRPAAAHKFFTRSVFWVSQFPDQYLGVDTVGIRRNLDDLLSALDRDLPSSAILADDFEPIHRISSEEFE